MTEGKFAENGAPLHRVEVTVTVHGDTLADAFRQLDSVVSRSVEWENRSVGFRVISGLYDVSATINPDALVGEERLAALAHWVTSARAARRESA